MGLNGIVEDDVTLLVKGSVFQVDDCGADEVIPEDGVVVPDFDFQNRVFGKFNHLVNFLVELGVIDVLDVLVLELHIN